MRILEVGKFYPPVRGGMETVLATLCRGLVRRGHSLRVLVSNDGWPGRRETIEGIELRRLGSWGMLRSVSLTPALFRQLRVNIREFEPDLVHLHLPHPAAGCAWLGVSTDVPLLLSYHSDIVRQRWLARLWEPGRRRLLKRARRILVSSDALAHSSSALEPYLSKCASIPFGIDTEPFDATSAMHASEARQPRDRYLLFVGRLVYYKGLDVLLEALEGNDMVLRVAGSGPMRRQWQTLAERRGLGARVQFLGERDDRQLRELLAGCVALVLPSTQPSESFGIVQLEAMAASRPVVVARASGGVESVQRDGETGLLVPPGDAEALRAALLRLWGDDALCSQLGLAARRRLDANFTADRMVARVEAEMQAIVEGP